MVKKILFLVLLLHNICLESAGIILGDRSVDSTDSFSFDLLSKTVFDDTNYYFYVASSQALTGDAAPYSIAGTSSNAQTNRLNGFVSVTPEKITLNGEPNQNNPLYAKAITQFGSSGNLPVATITDGTTLYWITSKLTALNKTMVSVSDIKDASGNGSAEVVNANENPTGSAITGTGIYLFAAIKAGGDFGDASGGIALFKKDKTTLTQQKALVGDDDNVKAIEIAVDTAALKIGDADLASLVSNAVDLYWSDSLQRLFIAVRTTDAGNDGACCVLVGYLSTSNNNNTKLVLNAIVPSTAFTAGVSTEIVGSPEANASINIYRVSVLKTSTGLHYLIVQGNAEGENPDKLYALPLVNESVNPRLASTWKTSVTHATLAQYSSSPTVYYKTQPKNNVLGMSGRGFQSQATVAGQLANSSTTQVVVGNADVPGTVSDIKVEQDAVFVATSAAADGQPVGVFYSQPVFDQEGKIKAWTAWKRISYHTGSLYPNKIGYVKTKGTLLTLEGTDTVKTTQWSTGANDGLLGGTTADSSVGFVSLVNNEFTSENGGVMSYTYFDNTHPAFAAGANNVALSVVTGYKKIVIAKMGQNDGTNLVATTGDFATDKRTFIEGKLSNISVESNGIQAGTKFITVSGGALDTLGPIVTSTIVEDPSTSDRGGYLVVGGVGGVAILRNAATGAGWSESGLVKDFSTGFGARLEFETIGSYTNVKKVWTAVSTDDVQVLYILTDKNLYRINASNLDDANSAAITLASLSDLSLSSSDSFSDFVASKCLGLLATSNGLYRTGNGANISTAANAAAVLWTQVDLPESYTPVTKLFTCSGSNLPYNFADGQSGQVDCLCATVAFSNAALQRLYIKNSATQVTSATVQAVSYPWVKNADGTVVNSPLVFLGNYYNNFASNGVNYFVTGSANGNYSSDLVRLPLTVGNGSALNYTMQATIDLDSDQTNKTVLGLERNLATGSWLAYGSFGLRVLE